MPPGRSLSARELRIGLCAGAAALAVPALILLLLGLIPSQAVHGFFGARYAHPRSEWLADALLSSSWGRTASAFTVPGGRMTPLAYTGLSFGALLVFAATLWLVGRQVRRHVPATLRQRAAVLLLTAVSVAAGTAIAAVSLRHTVPALRTGDMMRPRAEVTYDPLSHFFGGLAATLLIGVFAFGVVALLPKPWPAALRRAGTLVGLCLLAGGLLFPLFVVADGLPGARISEDFGHAAGFSAAAGGLVVPLGLQAPVALVTYYDTPWINYHMTSDANVAHWRKLAASTLMDHPEGRLYQHAASLGLAGSVVGAALTLAVVCALIFVSWRLCHAADAGTPGHGLRLGLLQAAAVTTLLVPTWWLTSHFVHLGPPRPMSLGLASETTYWGITGAGLVQSLLTVVAVCGLTGLAYGVWQANPARTARTGSTSAGDGAASASPDTPI